MMDVYGDVEADRTTNLAQCVENDSIEDAYIALLTYNEGRLIEYHLVLAAVLYGSDVHYRERRREVSSEMTTQMVLK